METTDWGNSALSDHIQMDGGDESGGLYKELYYKVSWLIGNAYGDNAYVTALGCMGETGLGACAEGARAQYTNI